MLFHPDFIKDVLVGIIIPKLLIPAVPAARASSGNNGKGYLI